VAFGFGIRLQAVGRVLSEVERPTLADEPIVDVLTIDVANGQQSVLSITGVADAIDLPAVQVIPQPLRRSPGRKATPGFAVPVRCISDESMPCGERVRR
jgi:hypothetical protein